MARLVRPRATGNRAAGKWLVYLILMALLSGCGRGPASREADPVRVQLGAMSLEERLGQLVLIGVEGQALDARAQDLIQADHVGGIILYHANIASAGQTLALLNSLKAANASSKAPLWLSVDQEGGKVSRMPDEYAKLPPSGVIGQSNNREYAFEIGSILGAEVKSLGFNMNFAPVLDVNSNPDNPVIGERSFGNSPDLVSALGLAAMKGIQSQKVVSVVKHFPGHGDTSVDSHLDLPVVDKSLESLRALELRPFEQAAQAGADAVMVAHLLLPKLDDQHPASFSRPVITGLLREQLHYDGVVITDDMTMGAISGHFDIGQAAVQAVNAGADIVMVAHDYNRAIAVLTALKQAAANGALSQETIDRSAYRILALKQKYQLSDQPSAEPDAEAINERIHQVLNRYAPATGLLPLSDLMDAH